jgi:hypothetical protein
MLPVPSWVHPAWLVCAGLLTLVVARKAVGLRWTATLLAGTYLAYRAVAWVLLTSTGFPPSVLPVMLLAGAVLVDVAVTARVPGWLAALPVTVGTAVAALGQSVVAVIPPWNWAVVPAVAVGFALLWAAVDRVSTSTAFARWKRPVEPEAALSGDTPGAVGPGGATAR